jgi:hypothetical protein
VSQSLYACLTCNTNIGHHIELYVLQATSRADVNPALEASSLQLSNAQKLDRHHFDVTNASMDSAAIHEQALASAAENPHLMGSHQSFRGSQSQLTVDTSDGEVAALICCAQLSVACVCSEPWAGTVG